MADRIITSFERRDFESGELKRSEKEQSWKTHEPDFVKLYMAAWCEFKNIKGINTSFLYALLPYMGYADGDQLIYTNNAIKKEIGKKLGWSEKTVTNRASLELQKLCKSNILHKIENGKYMVNPELVGHGKWKDIRKCIAKFNLSTGKTSLEMDQKETENFWEKIG